MDERTTFSAASWTALAAALALPPTAFFFNLQFGYASVQPACGNESVFVLYASAAFSALLCLGSGALLLALWVRRRPVFGARPPVRFLSAVALFLSVLFLLVITGQFIAMVLFNPCER